MAEAGIPERSRKKELSRVSGVSYESVRKWFTGQTTSIETEHLAKIAKRYKKSLDWLANGKESQGSTVSCRVPLLRKENIKSYYGGDTQYEPVGGNAELIRDASGAGPRTFAYVETGDGMSPRIEIGDTVYIDPDQNECKPGREIWLFSVGTGFSLGAVTETPRGLMLRFDNNAPGWEPMPIQPSDCMGKVVAFVPSWLS